MYYLIQLVQPHCWGGGSISPFHRWVTQRFTEVPDREFLPREPSESYLSSSLGSRAPIGFSLPFSIQPLSCLTPTTHTLNDRPREPSCQGQTLVKSTNRPIVPVRTTVDAKENLGWELASAEHLTAL